MCEKKNKKLRISLFLIPLIGLLSTFFVGIHGSSAYAVACPAGYKLTTTYKIPADKGDIIMHEEGYKLQPAQGSYNSGQCDKVNDSTTFKYSGEGLVYFANGNKASDHITLNKAPTRDNDVSATYQNYDAGGATGAALPIIVAVDQDADITTVTDANSDTGSGADGKTSCNVQGVGWIVCPSINFFAGLADVALSFLSDSFLSVNTELYDTNSGTYSAWQGILGFANVIFVIIFLIIIFAQATGVGISNYGIKKMLPKLIIGVILINISYFICQALVDVSNITGYGFNKFFENIQTVVVSQDPATDTNGGIVSWQYIAGSVLSVAAGVGAAYLLGLSVLIPMLFVAVISLLLIFLILILRQALIVICIIIAPLAFAAWLLPNTEKFFKQWWGIFSKLLLVFPIIAIVFGACRLASTILRDAYTNINAVSGVGSENVGTNSSEIIGQIISAGILVIPLIAVPFILKGAVSSIPVLGNMMQKAYNNQTGKARQLGTNSGLAQYDKQRKANRNARVASGNYRGAGGFANPFNVGSRINRGLNKNSAFNAATFGYGANRDLTAQRQGEKDRKDAEGMFNQNEGLMQVVAATRGLARGDRGFSNLSEDKQKAYDNLDDSSKKQFRRMQQTGLTKRSNTYLAITDYMSQNGKGTASTFTDAIQNAKATGADSAELSDAYAGAYAAYRGSGRGDIMGQLKALSDSNDADRDANGNLQYKSDGTLILKDRSKRVGVLGSGSAEVDRRNAPSQEMKLEYMESAWAEVKPDKAHRDAFKVQRDVNDNVILGSDGMAQLRVDSNGNINPNDLGMAALQRHLRASSRPKSNGEPGDGGNIGNYLEKYNDMDPRTQRGVKDTLVAAAEEYRIYRYNLAKSQNLSDDQIESKYLNRITNINQAKDSFGLLPGGRSTSPLNAPPSVPDPSPQSSTPQPGGTNPTQDFGRPNASGGRFDQEEPDGGDD